MMNFKKLFFLLCALAPNWVFAFQPPCAANGTLNVGIDIGGAPVFNLPYAGRDATTGQIFGFDIDLVCALAKLVGLNLAFIEVADQASAQAKLQDGTIDLYANSLTSLDAATLADFGGLVTDIAAYLKNTGDLRGYLLNKNCCRLMKLLELAMNIVVQQGLYAANLQAQRADPRQAGFTTGMGIDVLVQPFVYHSSMAGTIPSTCATTQVVLPTTNCISQGLLSRCGCNFSFRPL